MKRAMLIGVCVALLLTAVAVGATRRELTPEELAAITAYLDQRQQEQGTRNWSIFALKGFRKPDSLWCEYERAVKFHKGIPGKTSDRWIARPKFPGWQDTCYRWYPNGKSYQSQLYCTKCKALRKGNGWVNPSGFSCQCAHPKSLMEQWQFAVALIATDHQKPMEAKAHLWNALQHEDLTEAQWDELMVLVDAIEAEAAAKANAATEVKAKAKPASKTP